ncbi:MAG: enoyl-CoA hydratase/isomerase family protein [Rhodospirillaceae bacterium]|nr:enoyl-CoA hydratase/isomerase family protein [Rhodospirillaceae bacterium]
MAEELPQDLIDPRIRLDFDGALAIVTLDRAEKLNALDQAMLVGLEDAFDRVEDAKDARVMLLCGAGKAFCAGGDIAAWAALSPLDFAHGWVKQGHRTFDRLARLRLPTIAVLSGHAFGGGLELAGACDFRVADNGIKLGLPETGLGMVPGWSGTQRLVRRFGAQLIRRLSLGGEMLGAEAALEVGLVDRVVAPGLGLAAAREMAQAVAARGPAAVQAAKLMINAAEGEEVSAPVEILASAMIAATADLREGVAAFREKRKPGFEGR